MPLAEIITLCLYCIILSVEPGACNGKLMGMIPIECKILSNIYLESNVSCVSIKAYTD